MFEQECCIFSKLLANRIEKFKNCFAGAVGVPHNIWKRLEQRIVYSKLHAKFGVSSSFKNWELWAHTDRHDSIDCASDTEQESLYFMGSIMHAYAC